MVKGSGFSEKALMKPALFFCRKMRRMNASREVATTLCSHPSNRDVLDILKFEISREISRDMDID